MDFLSVGKTNNDSLAADIAKRFTQAETEMSFWMQLLQKTYELCMPNAAKFTSKERVPGEQLDSKVFDPTAVLGCDLYASNIISNLMPAGTIWGKLTVGRRVKGQNQNVAKPVLELLDHMTKTIFDVLNNSNFYNAVTQSLREMAISTGILLVNETQDVNNPVEFTSIPLHECVFEPGPNGIENVFRKFELEAEVLLAKWPKAKFGAEVMRQIHDDPRSKITVIESTIRHRDQPENKQWCYSVMVMGQQSPEMALIEYRSYSPFIVFRPQVWSGEFMGRGVMLNSISYIRTLNRIAHDHLMLNAYQSQPILLSNTGTDINPYTAKISPGAIVPCEFDGNGKPGIQQLQIQGNLDYNIMTARDIRAELNAALGINPVQAQGESPNETATRTHLLNQAWLARNADMFGRLNPELCAPILKTTFHILHRLGFWKPAFIDGHKIDIEWTSPVMDNQKNQNVDALMRYSQTLQGTLGPQDALTALSYGLNIEKLPTWLATQLNIDEEIKRDALSQHAMKQAASQQMQQQQAAQQQQQQPQQPQGMQNGPMGQQQQSGQVGANPQGL